MKKLSCLVLLGASGLILASCGSEEFDSSKEIKLYTRDTTSGTRDGFFTTIGLEDAKSDNSYLKSSISTVSSNGDMINALASDTYGIGYFSLSSVNEETGLAKDNENVKSIQYEGVTPTEDSVLDGQYKLTRNFNYIIRAEYSDENKQDIIEAFVAYMFSQEGMSIMHSAGGILEIPASTPSWSTISANYPIMTKTDLNIQIKVGGSTSVEDMSVELTDAFSALFADGAQVSFDHNHTGSGDAYKNTQGEGKDSASALDIAFLSREINLTSSEPAAQNTYGKMCTDAIVVGVNAVNPITNVTASELVDVYSKDGTTTIWSELLD